MNPDRAEGGELDWSAYLSEFHAERTGIVEAVLSRAMAGDHSPYRWLPVRCLNPRRRSSTLPAARERCPGNWRVPDVRS